MASFATGFLAAIAVAGLTLWAMMAGTVTIAERSDTVSTVVGDIPDGTQSPAGLDTVVEPGG